jgi:hypothetical protein
LEYYNQTTPLLTLSLQWIIVCKSDPFTEFPHDFLSQKTFLCLQCYPQGMVAHRP